MRTDKLAAKIQAVDPDGWVLLSDAAKALILELDAVKVVVACDGGLVQDVCANVPVEWAMIDYDVEGADEDRLTAIPQDDGTTTEAYAYTAHADVLPERVAQLFEAI